MADLNGTSISRGRVGANTLDFNDGISALIVTAQIPTVLTPFGTVKIFYNMVDVEMAGFTQSYDNLHGDNVYRHLKEFYRMAGEGQKLYFMLVNSTSTYMEQIIDNEVYAKKLLIAAKGEVRQLAIACNKQSASTSLNGMPTEVYNSIAKAQGLYDWAFENHMPLNILLEGYSITNPISAMADLRALEDLEAHKVSVVIGQDWEYAETVDSEYTKKFADVGTALGTLSAATVEQNIGDNEAFNLTDATKGLWRVPGISSHTKCEDVFEQLQTLEDKGYIFGLEYSGLEGVRWNNDHVCAPIVQDADGNINEHSIAYGRVHDKSLRLLRTVLLPKIKKSYPVDPATGKLPIGVQKYFKGLGDDVYAGMIRRKEISAGEMFVDPNSDLVTEKVLKTSYVIVPYGTIGEITGSSNLRTNTA